MIVSRFASFTEIFVIWCNQITTIFCTRYGSANASSARSPCNCGSHADLAISVFREVSFNNVFTLIHTSRRRRLQRWLVRRTCVWVSVFRNSVIHRIFSEFLQQFRYVGMIQVSPFLIAVFVFIWFGIFCLALSTAPPLGFQKKTGLPVLAFQHVYLITRSCLATLSLDTVEDVMVGEVDEHEEDVGWSTSCLQGVMDVEEGKLAEELVDNPGTTIGTKFSNEMWFFDRWSTHKSIRVHRKAFQATKLLAYPRGLSLSRKIQFFDKLWPLHASALLHWPLWLSLDNSTSSKFPILQNSSPFYWSCASALPSLQQILFPQV